MMVRHGWEGEGGGEEERGKGREGASSVAWMGGREKRHICRCSQVCVCTYEYVRGEGTICVCGCVGGWKETETFSSPVHHPTAMQKPTYLDWKESIPQIVHPPSSRIPRILFPSHRHHITVPHLLPPPPFSSVGECYCCPFMTMLSNPDRQAWIQADQSPHAQYVTIIVRDPHTHAHYCT